MRKCLLKADVLVCHNLIRFDKPVFEKLLGIKIKAKLVDSLAVSWYLDPMRQKHGLEVWGEEFGIPKPVIKDWHNLSSEEYLHRCEEDVKINKRLWDTQWNRLLAIYKTEKEVWRFLEYLEFKMQCAYKQERDRWKLDVKYTEASLVKLLEEQTKKLDALRYVMPKVPIYVKKTAPKRPARKDGTPSKIGQEWFDLLERQNLPKETEETEVLVGWEEPNPQSPVQIKEWLFSLGWKPETVKHVKNKKTGESRDVPQINKEFGAGICDSIKKLYEKEPQLELLDGLSILNHRIPMLSGFLDNTDNQGYIQAQVRGLTNTLRFKHTTIVNLPKVGKPYGEEIRGSLIAPEGYELCGADMSSLEDRLKQHFIFPLDPGYVQTMLRDDFDPHLELAMIANELTPEDKKLYQRVDKLLSNEATREQVSPQEITEYKKIKSIRSIFKNGNYACQYGAYPPRLVITCGISKEKAQELFDAYWKLNWAIKEVSARQVVKEVDGQKWLQNPVNKFWYSLRSENDRFSTLVQGTASYVFDVWLGFVLEGRDQLTAQFHDEIVLCVRKGYREDITEYLEKTIQKTNDLLKLNRELGIGIQFGARYSEIH